MLEFLVLGIIPGTHTQLSLTWIAGVASGLFVVTTLAAAYRRATLNKAMAALGEVIAVS